MRHFPQDAIILHKHFTCSENMFIGQRKNKQKNVQCRYCHISLSFYHYMLALFLQLILYGGHKKWVSKL